MSFMSCSSTRDVRINLYLSSNTLATDLCLSWHKALNLVAGYASGYIFKSLKSEIGLVTFQTLLTLHTLKFG